LLPADDFVVLERDVRNMSDVFISLGIKAVPTIMIYRDVRRIYLGEGAIESTEVRRIVRLTSAIKDKQKGANRTRYSSRGAAGGLANAAHALIHWGSSDCATVRVGQFIRDETLEYTICPGKTRVKKGRNAEMPILRA
jgi:hypothetical protein